MFQRNLTFYIHSYALINLLSFSVLRPPPRRPRLDLPRPRPNARQQGVCGQAGMAIQRGHDQDRGEGHRQAGEAQEEVCRQEEVGQAAACHEDQHRREEHGPVNVDHGV